MRNKEDINFELMKINLSVIVNQLEMDLKNPPEEAVILIKKDLIRLREIFELRGLVDMVDYWCEIQKIKGN